MANHVPNTKVNYNNYHNNSILKSIIDKIIRGIALRKNENIAILNVDAIYAVIIIGALYKHQVPMIENEMLQFWKENKLKSKSNIN